MYLHSDRLDAELKQMEKKNKITQRWQVGDDAFSRELLKQEEAKKIELLYKIRHEVLEKEFSKTILGTHSSKHGTEMINICE